MRMDPTYEQEEMETNMENMFEHVNEMSNTDMPRDFLASLSKHFLRTENEKFTSFQRLQTEACLLIEQRRPHWRKRKAMSSSQLVSMFYILEKEVLDSNDEVAKNLFVEAFHSREAYIEAVMTEFDETDKLEKKMSSGPTLEVPGYMYDDDDEGSIDDDSSRSGGFNFNNFVLEVSDLMEDLSQLDQSKYVKVFEKAGDASIGIHNTRIKALAKRKDAELSKLPTNVKNYPTQVKSTTKTFTKLTASSSRGAENTLAGYCLLIDTKHLDMESKARVLTVLGRDDLLVDMDNMEAEEPNTLDDDDLIPSQDFPNLFQSQTAETLRHCTLCEFMSRSKVDFGNHVAEHPTCNVCRKQFESEETLTHHMNSDHPNTKERCHTCGKDVLKREVKEHAKEHEIFSSFKKGLDKNAKSMKSKGKVATKPNMTKKKKNCYLLFIEEKREDVNRLYPEMSPVEITKKLSEDWKALDSAEKARYKERAAEANGEEVCPKCVAKFTSKEDVINHLMNDHIREITTPSVEDSTQSTIFKCNLCGRMFLNDARLQAHKRENHENVESIDQRADEFIHIGHQGEGPDATVNEPHVDHDVTTPNTETVHEEEVDHLVWVKLASIVWPAKVMETVGELTKIQILDEESTVKTVEALKIKPFSPLTRVPVKRTKIWKAAYARALELLKH